MGTGGLRNSGTRKQDAGFTLVETLVAIVVLVFGLIAVTNLMVVASTSNQVGNAMTAATTAARRTMDDLKATPFGALAIGGNADVDNCPAFCRDDVVPGVGLIHVRWETLPAPGMTQVVFIRVQAESTAPLAGARSRSEFTTFRSCTDQGIGCLPPP